ncbi:MAG: ATP-binding protein [Halioglobus sp.]
MSLRRQLLLVSLLLLSLPWAGCQFVREMEGALRYGQEQSMQATTQAIAAVLNHQPELLYPTIDRLSAVDDAERSIYADPRQEPIIVDGYSDSWERTTVRRMVSEQGAEPLAVSYQAVTRKGRLFLLFQVEDSKVIYHNPGLSREPNGDRLMLRTWKNNKRQEYVIATAAPGAVKAKPASPVDRSFDAGRIRGQWQDSQKGYTLELEMPLSATGGRLGFFIIDATGKSGEGFKHLGTVSPIDMAAPPWLIYAPAQLEERLAPFVQRDRLLTVIDRHHWQVAQAQGNTQPGAAHHERKTFWLLQLLYRSILAHDKLATQTPTAKQGKIHGTEVDQALAGYSAHQRYRNPDNSTRTALSSATPIYNGSEVIGAVVLQQSSEEYLSLTDQAFGRILSYSLIAIGIGVSGLLVFASVLSWRIRTLSKAARTVANSDDIVGDSFPRSGANDEIGELSRSYADLLHKLRQYNDYLRTLSRKLSHELRTPIAVIQTSLENLRQPGGNDIEDRVYLARAQGGLTRLANILNAMSEASGLEESIRGNNKAPLDLVALMQEIFSAYQSVYTQHKLELHCTSERAMTLAAPELLVQALDKFMDNATSFCPVGGTISLHLRDEPDHWRISVSNEGPPLPEQMQGQLFDSMVSIRDKGSENVHLGLGLHIAQLIADFHEAQVDICNLADNSGVCCSIALEKLTH